MHKITHVYWRDIPAQVIVGRGRKACKAPLSERFEKAIDAAAMRLGARDSDAYLAEWRRVAAGEAEGEAQNVATAEVTRLEAAYPPERLREIVLSARDASP